MFTNEQFTPLDNNDELADYLRQYDFITYASKTIPPFLYNGIEAADPVLCKIIGYTNKFDTWSTVVIDFGKGCYCIHSDVLKEMQKGLSKLKKDCYSELFIEIEPSNPKVKKEKYPSNYVMFDIETSGYSYNTDKITEISALKVENFEIIDSFSSLINVSDPIPESITKLTGINNKMLTDAPDINEVVSGFMDFIGDYTIIGHNIASFDIPFINAALSPHNLRLNNKYVDTLKMSRSLIPELESHSLKSLSALFNISYDGAHRALNDCHINNSVYLKLLEIYKNPEVKSEYNIIPAKPKPSQKPKANYFNNSFNTIKAKDITTSVTEFNTSHPIYTKTCVITGDLIGLTREEAMQKIADLGGVNADNITKKTDYLIIGGVESISEDNTSGRKSGKQKKAEEYISKGCDIHIICEKEFVELIK